MTVTKKDGSANPIIASPGQQFLSREKADKLDLYFSRDLSLVHLSNIKNILSKVPKGCWFELEFVIDEKTRNILKTFRNTKTNEYLGDVIDKIFPTDGSNAYIKVLAHNVTGLSQTTDKKQFKVLNREWTLPKTIDFGSISVDFYDMVYQYKFQGKLINKYFNVSEFFKVWMDNMFVLDSRGRPLSTRLRYLFDYVVPKLKIYQYYPAIGTKEKNQYETTYEERKRDPSRLTIENVLEKSEYEKRFNLFTTTWIDVVQEKENVKSQELIYNTTFLRLIQGTFKYVFAYGASALGLGLSTSSFVSQIVASAKGTNTDTEYSQEVIKYLSQKLLAFFSQQSSPDLGQNQILTTLSSDLDKVNDVEDFLNVLTSLVTNEEFQKVTENILNSPDVQRITQESFETVGVKHGVLQREGFDFLNETDPGISLIVKKLRENRLLENAGLDPAVAVKVKKLAESFETYLTTLNSSELQDGVPKGSTTNEAYAKQKWETVKTYFEHAFYQEQQNAYDNLFNPFNFDMEDDILQVNDKGELVKVSRTDTFPHGKTGFSKTNEVHNKIRGGAAKGLQILSLALGLYVFTFALVDLAKLFTKENVIREMDPNHGLKMSWDKFLKFSGSPAAIGSDFVKFSYSRNFFNYLQMVSTPNASWWGGGNQLGQTIGNSKTFGDFINNHADVKTVNTDSEFSTIEKINVGVSTVFGVTPVKEFTFYNVWPVKVAFSDMNFESQEDLSKINVEFAYTFFEEN